MAIGQNEYREMFADRDESCAIVNPCRTLANLFCADSPKPNQSAIGEFALARLPAVQLQTLGTARVQASRVRRCKAAKAKLQCRSITTIPISHASLKSKIASKEPQPSNTIATLAGRPLLSNSGIPLDLNWVQEVRVNTSAVERRAQTQVARRTVKKEWQAAWLLRAISCMDLTTLSGDDTDERVRRLCAKGTATHSAGSRPEAWHRRTRHQGRRSLRVSHLH